MITMQKLASPSDVFRILKDQLFKLAGKDVGAGQMKRTGFYPCL